MLVRSMGPVFIKLAFHDADTDTGILADILAESRRFSRGCRRVGRVGDDPREDVGVGVVEFQL